MLKTLKMPFDRKMPRERSPDPAECVIVRMPLTSKLFPHLRQDSVNMSEITKSTKCPWDFVLDSFGFVQPFQAPETQAITEDTRWKLDESGREYKLASVEVQPLNDVGWQCAYLEGIHFDDVAGAHPENQKFRDLDGWNDAKKERYFTELARVTYMAQCELNARAKESVKRAWNDTYAGITGLKWHDNPWCLLYLFDAVQV